jgi:hypothetical protein
MEKDCDTGLDQRCRDEDGTIRRKRSDTHVTTLRREYGEDFAAGIRSDATLGTVLERAGVESLSEYLRTRKK